MKALVILEPGRLALKDILKPVPGPGEILVRMSCCGVCGTDIEKVMGQAITPMVLGHEVVGEVAKFGGRVRGLKEGDRVFAHHHAPCYACATCARAEYTMCEEFPKHNLVPGGFSEFYAVPRWNVEKGAVLRLPDSLADEEGTFIEPLGCCLRGLSKVGAEECRSALIYGAGPVGLLHLLLLRNLGFESVCVADLSRYRLSFASNLGATAVFDPTNPKERERALGSFGGLGPELAVVATGSPSALAESIQSVAPGGRVLMFGAPVRGSTIQINLPEYFRRGVSLISSYSTSEKETALALEMLAEGRVKVSGLISHRFNLARAPEAFRVAQEQKCVKALVCN